MHLANAGLWRQITGEHPPTRPPSAADYTEAGLPWFEYYGADRQALSGGPGLGGIKSVAKLGSEKGEKALPENEPVDPVRVVALGSKRSKSVVRDGQF